MKKNFNIVIRCLAGAGLLLAIISMLVKGEPERSILRLIGVVMTLALLIQVVIFGTKRGLFDDRPTHPD